MRARSGYGSGDRNAKKLLATVGAAVKEYNRARPNGAPPVEVEVRTAPRAIGGRK